MKINDVKTNMYLIGIFENIKVIFSDYSNLYSYLFWNYRNLTKNDDRDEILKEIQDSIVSSSKDICNRTVKEVRTLPFQELRLKSSVCNAKPSMYMMFKSLNLSLFHCRSKLFLLMMESIINYVTLQAV